MFCDFESLNRKYMTRAFESLSNGQTVPTPASVEVAPAVTGYLVEWSGSFTSAFALTGGIAVVGALAVAVLVREPRREVVSRAVPAI
jgi:hypothetical protein